MHYNHIHSTAVFFFLHFKADKFYSRDIHGAVATTSLKHVTKLFRVAKRTLHSMAAERQLLCCAVVGRFIEFILRDNCTTAIVDILKVQVQSSSCFQVHCRAYLSLATRKYGVNGR